MIFFSRLPDSLIIKILDYTNIIVFRHGKYMNRINIYDYRYILLEKVCKPIKIGKNKILIKLINYTSIKPCGYLIEYIFFDFYTIIELKFICEKIMNFEKHFHIKNSNKYIFNINSKYTKLVNYSM